jgi:hypothetical protein
LTTSAKRAPRRARRLASGPQLCVLNRAGRLQLREPELENEITSELADLAIRRSIEEAADVEGPDRRGGFVGPRRRPPRYVRGWPKQTFRRDVSGPGVDNG